MTDAERTQDKATTTEQIAAAGTADSQDRTSPGQRPPGDGQAGQSASATQAGAGSGPGGGEQPPAQLLADDELQSKTPTMNCGHSRSVAPVSPRISAVSGWPWAAGLPRPGVLHEPQC